jgi:hypothetical protein
MKLFAPALAAVALGCCVPVTRAQSAAPPADAPVNDNMLSRLDRWFGGDWSHDWDSGSQWRLMASNYTYHFSHDPEHHHVYMLGLQRERADGLLLGGTVFRNSFGQPSAYLYVGQRFDQVAGVDALFGQLTGGLLYGYKPPYERKVPLNYQGFSPGIVPGLGWKFTPALSAQLNFLGNSAVMFQLSAIFH